MHRILAGFALFLLFYTFFWANFFHVLPSKKQKAPVNSPTPIFDATTTSFSPALGNKTVLSATSVIDSIPKPNMPSSWNIPLEPRKQAFNLSCEFAAASIIIYHFTNNSTFSPKNEDISEKTLMQQVGVSKNPNVGIRMGDLLEEDVATLYKNLNKYFGGTDYYGVNAPPFLDLFPKYGLYARPITTQDGNASFLIKQAISKGNLVMAWIRIGYKQPVDIALSYGQIPIVKGEHVVVINGYDEKGFSVLDPGTGRERYILQNDLLTASQPFALPFLEVFPSSQADYSGLYQEILSENITGLPRGKLAIAIENGSGNFGEGTRLAAILTSFGYKIANIKNANNVNFENLTISMKKSVWDYSLLLKKDLQLVSYVVATISANLPEENKEDATIIVGN
jgi:uncharacterized protein YvpB